MEIKPENLPPELSADFGRQLAVVSQLYTALLGRLLAPHQLTYGQFALLAHLGRHGGPTRVSDIARAVDLTQSAVTKAVQKFAGLGLVEIARDTVDQRNRPVCITALGLQHLDEVQQAFSPAFAQLLDGWDVAELRRLTGDLTALSARLDAMRQQAAEAEA
ncbi:MAG: MarR family transcriptional regulator [Salinarimonas sp.]|nr:MarR family transcriptional regulator [Salinarimonas sp.]